MNEKLTHEQTYIHTELITLVSQLRRFLTHLHIVVNYMYKYTGILAKRLLTLHYCVFDFKVKVCLHVTDFGPSFAPFNRPCILLPINRTIKWANWVETHSVRYSAVVIYTMLNKNDPF